MNGVWSGRHGARATMLVVAVGATLAGGVLAGCGGANTSSIEKSVNKQIEKDDELAEETVKSVSKQAEAALEEAKTETKGEGSKQIEEATE